MIVLGIDVGGTYTDGVLLEMPGGTVIRKVKVKTDERNLSNSILQCFSRLNVPSPSLLSRFCLSTTLATNAIVEGTRKDVCAICIGFRPKRAIEYASETVVIEGRHDAAGREVQPIDLAALREAVSRSDRTSFAISGYFGVRNPRHEVLAEQEVLSMHPSATVVKGSDLVGILGMEERIFLAAKNAELIGLMSKFIDSIGSMAKVPESVIYILKGDGTLVSTREASRRPIFTVLSGPASSVMGGAALAKVRDALVIDIGGTTTDMALLENGRVRTSDDGAMVGNTRLRVESVDMTTIALGGDTEIYCRDGRPVLGERAVGPLCLAPDARRIMQDRSFLSSYDRKAFGVTPTDLFSAQGKSDFGDRDVAVEALTLMARECHMPLETLYGVIEDKIRLRLLRAIASTLLGITMLEGGEGEALLAGSDLMWPSLKIKVPIVGIGAPVRHFLDLVADRVDTDIVIPKDHDVGNAVGAACAEVYGRKEVRVRAEARLVGGEEVITYHVTTEDGQRIFSSKEEAVSFAIKFGRASLEDYMSRNRVKRYEVRVETWDRTYIENGRTEYVETIITLSAGGT